MRCQLILTTVILSIGLESFSLNITRAEEVPAKYRPAIAKGLEWLVRNQHPDGHWGDYSGNYSEVVTALAGMSLLMEGSTVREGKYQDHIRRAVNWLMTRSQPNGLIGVPGKDQYMYGHGFSMRFLSSVVGEEDNAEHRYKLVDILD